MPSSAQLRGCLQPADASAPRCRLTNELLRCRRGQRSQRSQAARRCLPKNPAPGRLMAGECVVLTKWNRLFSLRDADIIKAS